MAVIAILILFSQICNEFLMMSREIYTNIRTTALNALFFSVQRTLIGRTVISPDNFGRPVSVCFTAMPIIKGAWLYIGYTSMMWALYYCVFALSLISQETLYFIKPGRLIVPSKSYLEHLRLLIFSDCTFSPIRPLPFPRCVCPSPCPSSSPSGPRSTARATPPRGTARTSTHRSQTTATGDAEGSLREVIFNSIWFHVKILFI